MNNVILSDSNGLHATKSWATNVSLISGIDNEIDATKIENLTGTFIKKELIFEKYDNFASLISNSTIESGILKCIKYFFINLLNYIILL